MSTFLLLREALLLLSSWPDLLNTLSLGTDDPGTHKSALATSAKIGIKVSFFFHHSSGSPMIWASESYKFHLKVCQITHKSIFARGHNLWKKNAEYSHQIQIFDIQESPGKYSNIRISVPALLLPSRLMLLS